MDDEVSGIATTCDVSTIVPNTAVLSVLFLLLSCSIYDLTNGSLPRVWIPNLYFFFSTNQILCGRVGEYRMHVCRKDICI